MLNLRLVHRGIIFPFEQRFRFGASVVDTTHKRLHHSANQQLSRVVEVL